MEGREAEPSAGGPAPPAPRRSVYVRSVLTGATSGRDRRREHASLRPDRRAPAPPSPDKTTLHSTPHRPRTTPPLVHGPSGPSDAPASGSGAGPRFRRRRRSRRRWRRRLARSLRSRSRLRSPSLPAADGPAGPCRLLARFGRKPYHVERARTNHGITPDPHQRRGNSGALTPGIRSPSSLLRSLSYLHLPTPAP